LYWYHFININDEYFALWTSTRPAAAAGAIQTGAEIPGAMFIRTLISVFTRLGDVCEFARELATPRIRHLEFG
jgi:hypothetical protein